MKKLDVLINTALEQNSIHEFYPEFKKIMNLADVSANKSEIITKFDDALLEKFDKNRIKIEKNNASYLNMTTSYRIFDGNKALLYYLFLFFPYKNNIHLKMNDIDEFSLWKVFEKGITEGKITEPTRESPYSSDEIYDICDMLNAEFGYSHSVLTPNDTVLLLNDTVSTYGTSFFRGNYDGMLVSTIILPVPNDGFAKKGTSDSDLLFHEIGNDLAFKYSKGSSDVNLFKELPIVIDDNTVMNAGFIEVVADLLGFGLSAATPFKHLPREIINEIGDDQHKQELFYELLKETIHIYIDRMIKARTYN